MLRCALITVGDTGRQTGGYLYHREVAARLAARGVVLEQVVAAGAQLQAQLAAAPGFAERFDPTAFDLLLVDALARAVCAPTLDAWGLVRPLVAMVHELPSVAGGLDAPAQTAERTREAPLLRAQRLIAVSDDGARLLRARGVAPERIVVAPGGCDRFAFARPLARSPADALSRLPLRVLCVAQWIPRKGVLELAQAWSAVAPLGWVLELVGETDADSAYAQAVRAALAKAPPASVVLHGVLSDEALAAAYGRAALFAMPSRYEGYGIAFAEALACGLPVLGCAVGPVPALVGPEAGLLVPPGDTMALATALARLLDDRALRERMARAARARGAQLPSWEQCADGVLRALLEAAGR